MVTLYHWPALPMILDFMEIFQALSNLATHAYLNILNIFFCSALRMETIFKNYTLIYFLTVD